MIQPSEVKAAVELAFPRRPIQQMEPLKGGMDFVVYRVDFCEGDPVVFRGQRNFVSPYLGRLDFGQVLLGEVRFYEKLSHLPVPRLLYFDPHGARLGFPFAFFTCLPGAPLSSLLAQATPLEQQRVMREMGRLLGTIHQVHLDQVGYLGTPSPQSWAEYFSRRLQHRLQPHIKEGLVSRPEVEALVGMALSLELDRPRLLHMDFRPENLLAERRGSSTYITGIVDAANAIGGDMAFDLARSEEGMGLGPEFLFLLLGHADTLGSVDRQSTAYLLYRLETAALLVDVYRNRPEGAQRRQRFLDIKQELLGRAAG